MSYNDFIGVFKEPPEEIIGETYVNRLDLKIPDSDYENLRFGIPHGAISYDSSRDEIEVLVKHFLSCGYSTFPSTKLNKLKKHVAYFRACLDLWDNLCKGPKSMCKEEIYYRCLTEGPSFCNWVKKARSTSFRNATSETDTVIEEEYLLNNYSGYNSIIHERYLINWDTSDETDDVKYCFIPRNEVDETGFRKRVKKLFSDFRIGEIDFSSHIDMVAGLKNSVMYDPKKDKSILMRSFWNKDIDPRGPYYAVRRVVPIEPGNVRDTGVGDPGTILKVKQINMLCRQISEKLPYCANAPEKVCNERLKRVLKRNAFLHLDFKKFGLSFPRQLSNIMLEEIGAISGIDVDHLIIREFYYRIDGEVYQTERGSTLGWLDCLNCLCVVAILHWLSCEEELGFDFITFNDDVEISKFANSDVVGTLELLRLVVISEISSYDIPISLDKTFGSKGSVFLERYAYFGQYNIDMYKEQLTVKAYAQSLVTIFPWQAKMFHAAAEQWTKSNYATDRCLSTCPVEFRREECATSLWSGGWFIWRKDKLDLGIRECDKLGFLLGLELSKFKGQKYSTRPEETSGSDEIRETIGNQCYNSYSSSLGALMQPEVGTVYEINSDIELIREILETRLSMYEGRSVEFALRVSWLTERSLRVINLFESIKKVIKKPP